MFASALARRSLPALLLAAGLTGCTSTTTGPFVPDAAAQARARVHVTPARFGHHSAAGYPLARI